VKVGIEAPSDVPVHRQEVYDEIQRNNKQALTTQKAPLPRIPLAKIKSPAAAASPAAPSKSL
jgi:carbon storage regulator